MDVRAMAEALAAKVTPVRPWRAVRDAFVIGLGIGIAATGRKD